MKKTITLLVSGLVAASATLSVAAPLAKRALKPVNVDVLMSPTSETGNIFFKRAVNDYVAPVDGLFRGADAMRLRSQRAVKSATAASRALADNVKLVAQAGYLPGHTAYAFYYIPKTDDGDFSALGGAAPYLYNYGGYYDEEAGLFTGVYAQITDNTYKGGYIQTVNYTTGQVVNTMGLSTGNMGALALSCERDPVSGIVYGYFFKGNGTGYEWGSMDYTEGVRSASKEVPFEETCEILCVDNDGQYYGLTKADKLVKIDKTNGNTEVLANVDFHTNYAAGSCYNPANNSMLIYAVYDDQSGSGLYEVSLATGEVTQLNSYPLSQFYNLHMLVPAASDKAPAAPGLTASAPEGGMEVECTITLPTTLFDGTPLTGTVDWEIAVDDEVKFEGRNQAGSSVANTITVATEGYHTITAVARNADGASPKATVKLYVGKGQPAAPQNVKASYADGKMTVSWNAVTTTVNNEGYINSADVTYDVLNGEETVATGLNATTYTFDLAAPALRTSFSFKVVANYGGKRSEASESNQIWLGDYGVPFSTVFNSPDAFDEFGYTVIDANDDRNTWRATKDGAAYYYNRNQGDDWLITPDIVMEGNTAYVVTVEASCYSRSYPETFEVKGGKGKTVESMTLNVIPATTIDVEKPTKFEGVLITEEAGKYNVGVHGISNPNQWNLFITEIAIADGVAADAPEKAADLTITPDENGTLEVVGSVVAPARNFRGDAIDGDVTMNVYRGDDLVVSRQVAPGSTMNFTDVAPRLGTYTYTVVPSVGAYEGLGVSVTAYVGPYPAKAPTTSLMFESFQPGTVTLSWDAVTEDINGRTIDPANVTYQIYTIIENQVGIPVLPERTSATNATFKAIDDPERQQFVQYVVHAFNRDAESTQHLITDVIPVGKGYKMPVQYSGSADLASFNLAVNTSLTVSWTSVTTPTVGIVQSANFGIPSVDEDDQYFAVNFDRTQAWAEFFTGKIDLTAVERPEMTFYTYKFDNKDANKVEVTVVANGERTVISTIDNANLQEGWNKVRLNLERFKGKNVQISIKGTCVNVAYWLLDKLVVKETPDKDLAAVSLTAPVNVYGGQTFNIGVEVMNLGYETARNFTVTLYRDGEVLEERTVNELEPDESINVLFENLISYFDDNSDEAIYSAEVSLAGDKDESNDATESVTVTRVVSEFPAVTDLTAVAAEEGVKLSWSAYSTDDLLPMAITEDFEGAEAWSQAVDGWTIVDVDKRAIDGFANIDLPGITKGRSLAAFLVFDSEYTGFNGNTTFAAASGTKYLGSIYNYDGSQNRDWAISPRLCGDAQTVKFFVRAYSANYPEVVSVYYTTDDSVDPDDFEKLESFNIDFANWQEREVELPEGAMHFAIVGESKNAFCLMVDDVTYTPDPHLNALTLVGYDVYRDGVKLTRKPVTTGEYLDAEPGDGRHTYHVIACYSEGTSELSNPAMVEFSALTLVGADGTATVKVVDREIVVAGADDLQVTIASVDGRVVYTGLGDTRVAVAPAIYLVTVANRTHKLLVK